MGIALLKKLNTLLPDSVKILFAPIIRGKLIYNPIFQEQLLDLDRFDNMTREAAEKEQLRRLKETLIHAYAHTSYYKTLFDSIQFDPYEFSDASELKQIPVLTKEKVIQNFDALQADDISDYYTATTGGSTGTPLKINLDRESIYRERAFIYHFWQKYGYDYKRSRIASFRGTNFNGKICRANPLYNEIQLNPCLISSDTIQDYYRHMCKFGVTFLHGFPSAIYSFCKFAKAAGIEVHGKYKAVFLISENVYPFQKQFIEQTLGCVTAPFYGHSERAVFAQACAQGGGYVFQEAYCYSELSEENSGNIICTGFINRKMPFIRYALDDTAKKESDCYSITGHREGILLGRDDVQISTAALEIHSDLMNKIASYQFVQTKVGHLRVNLVPVCNVSDPERLALEKLFQDRVGCAFDVEAVIVKELTFTQRGKYRLLIQEIAQEE